MKTIAKKAQKWVAGKYLNIASHALLTMMIAQLCNLKLGDDDELI